VSSIKDLDAVKLQLDEMTPAYEAACKQRESPAWLKESSDLLDEVSIVVATYHPNDPGEKAIYLLGALREKTKARNEVVTTVRAYERGRERLERMAMELDRRRAQGREE